MAKIAHAVRTAGDCYDVTYPHHKDTDSNVPGRYLLALVRDGYQVRIDNAGFDHPRLEILKP